MRSEGEIKRSANPWVTLEMTVLKMAYAPDIMDLAEMLRRMDSGLPPSPPRQATRRRQRCHPVAVKSGEIRDKGEAFRSHRQSEPGA